MWAPPRMAAVTIAASPTASSEGPVLLTSALGFVSQGQLALAHLAAGSPAGVSASVTVVSSLTSVTSIAWSPDGTAFAAGGDDGVTRGLADGTALARVDTHAARGAVVWSVAR